MITLQDLIKISDEIYEIPKSFRADMLVPARLFANEAIIKDILQDKSLEQLVNVTTLPGIQKYAMAMPDIHQGYGFPIGGVAAMAIDEGGVISPGGIGYDINCGVRLLVSDLTHKEIKEKLPELATALFKAIPSGVGKGGKLEFKGEDLEKILQFGAKRLVELNYGNEQDLELCEENGCMKFADPAKVSSRAKNRGSDQLGTLGSGNHFLEVQKVDKIFDEKVATAFGLHENLVTIMIHCGSRGLGHQNCTDYVRLMLPKLKEWKIILPDRELACAPFNSNEGQDYFVSMAASANFAWANRHLIAHNARKAWKKFLGENSNLNLVYDVAHNIGKKELHKINGKEKEVIMHRKGATRAFPANHPEIPQKYKSVGQPVFIPGTMGTSSYVLVGTQAGMDISFGSSCHGAGRKLSRMQAKKDIHGTKLKAELEKQGIIIRTFSDYSLAEEAPQAYKDVEEVINVMHNSGIAKKVARLIPLAVIKGD